MWFWQRLSALETWRKHMDAQVTRAINDIVALKAAVAAVAAKLAALVAAQGAIDPDDEAAMAANNDAVEAQIAALQGLTAPAPAPAPAPAA
jgi:hypothetical protein